MTELTYPKTQQLSDLDKLAQMLTCSRSAFTPIFDNQAAKQPGSKRFNFIAMGLGTNQTKQAFLNALHEAHQNKWLKELWEQLISAGFVDTTSKSSVVLQQLTGKSPGFIDSRIMARGMIKCLKQICLIEIDYKGTKSSGSGFLVGPNAVITCGHVVRCLLNDKDKHGVKKDSHKSIKVRFDHMTGSSEPLICSLLESDWLLDYSPPHPDETDRLGRGTLDRLVSEQKLDGYLDYAVLGLATSPGCERGVVDLQTQTDTPHKGETWWILQHPEAFTQQVATGKFEGYRTDEEQRLLYSIDTLPGSSGGLVVNSEFQCVGLHQGAIKDSDVNGSRLNTGIAVGAILGKLKRDVLNPDPSEMPLFRRANDAGPIIGRENCRKWILNGLSGPTRINYVYSRGSHNGTSFSYEIMQACLPDDENVLTRISTDDLPLEAAGTAAELLKRMGIDLEPVLPDPAIAETTATAWIKANLLPAFRQLFNNAAAEIVYWLIIDDIDSKPIPDSGVRLFLEALYADIETMPNLRIVLVGQDYKPPSANARLTCEEVVKEPERAEIEHYIRRRFVQANIEFFIGSGETKRLANLVERSGTLDIRQLDQYIQRKLDPVFSN